MRDKSESLSLFSNSFKLGLVLLSITGLFIIYSTSPMMNQILSGHIIEAINNPQPNLLPNYIMIPSMIIGGIGIFLILREDYGI